jgi:hypothetical protein
MVPVATDGPRGNPRAVVVLTLGAEVALPAGVAHAGAPRTLSVLIAVGDLAVAERNVAHRTLPAVLAVAHTAAVLSVARAQHRAHALAAVRTLSLTRTETDICSWIRRWIYG